MCWTLGGAALGEADPSAVRQWLAEQGLDSGATDLGSRPSLSLIVSAVETYRDKTLGRQASLVAELSSSIINPRAKQVGVTRSGGGWAEGARFCIAAAFVPLLGSLEQFELDVLKSLLYYRPMGTPGPTEEWEDVVVDLEIVTEVPEVKGGSEYFTRPAIWTWIKPKALDKDQRRILFSRVFKIDLAFEDANRARNEVNNARKDYFEKRNKIAHGREGVEISLKEFADVDVFVTQSMLHLAKECRTKQRLIV